jgi:NADPH:quinone reductase-like Zn-dependent oxidoreductase
MNIIGSMLGNRAEFSLLLRLLGQKRLWPVIDRTMPLSNAAQAHRILEKVEQFGKIVLLP